MQRLADRCAPSNVGGSAHIEIVARSVKFFFAFVPFFALDFTVLQKKKALLYANFQGWTYGEILALHPVVRVRPLSVGVA